ncbi:adenosylcobinamide-GDP ribazoletransferase [Gloeocapsopsis dulcis]|uniref:Adenosylcobinamide-GDP ribazoletransferase n=1 Tax=Gloeocapsopsis dulcis AAB1 = 1H9 TaxID=1433147 RepID=A0A6N8FX17_9CHRO|nr:adenosylcobinamide-GDP ribazoletransferase [Gloeocapsopsis dulcis]MUL37613.1 adenosylcobinamide-GDP ribazoletransferase [Gloeocapsopsis dulcis AAB1 = 1H9]WNN89251.1 adenosylcobinamide-GDP ribazoletransferase [Gloeocapsopsis dulcis]
MDKQLWWKQLWCDVAAAFVFYTCLPIPFATTLDFCRVSRYVVLVGLVIGGILGFLDAGLNFVGIPVLTRTVLVVVSWIGLTGGLHLDGAMDTADGLAVQDPQKRLQVMADSATGAFGAMVAIALLFLKTAALSEISFERWFALMAACGWGRWGQQIAIARYSYLKPTGKGSFHKAALYPRDILLGLLLLLGLSSFRILLHNDVMSTVVIAISGSAIAFLTSAWFNRQLGGHTGDTYGAVVEWTEALLLCVLTVPQH